MNTTQNKNQYKNSPLGLIPEDWEVKTVAEAFKICNNLRSPISEIERKKIQGEFPYYGPTKIQDYISEFRVDGKYALIGEDGDHFLKWKDLPMTLLVEGRFNVNNHAHLIQGEENLTEWFYYYFNSKELTPHLTRQGAGRYKLTKKALGEMTCPIPPLPEQTAIANCLSTWDKAIATQTQIIAQKELRKKALMQQLLSGKKRLKEFDGVWKEVKLGDVFDRVTSKNVEVNTNVVTISAQRGFIRQGDYFNKIVASDVLDNYFLVQKGDYCYNKSYSNGYPWGATKRLTDFEKAVVTTLYICFRLKDVTADSGEFFQHFFEANSLDKGLTKIAHEGGRAHGLLNVTPNDFFSLKIIVPEFQEQTAIANVLQCADEEIQLSKKKLQQLKDQKKGLMQVLLTGKKRLVF
jgi:type I restriction enzyme S subunit